MEVWCLTGLIWKLCHLRAHADVARSLLTDQPFAPLQIQLIPVQLTNQPLAVAQVGNAPLPVLSYVPLRIRTLPYPIL